jgi:transcriptional regulator with PAS, ATPase and Fis domain
MDLQATLLRVLQEKEIRRIGSNKNIPVDVRVIAASNEGLDNLVITGKFREDLYFRLNILKIILPPLRERKEDIPELVTKLLQKYSIRYDKSLRSIPSQDIKLLTNLDWPGNIRQLEHLLERLVVLVDDEADVSDILKELIHEEYSANYSYSNGLQSDDQISVNIGTLADMSAELVNRMKNKAMLTNSELALRLGISRPTLLKMINHKLQN